ncbi:Sterol desaturase/sphingolipid hydroxylase, fatty acid hydroxylase superfamily [Aquipseudomonas alcaligenes]|uniref:sterol desaturase family protein n=1 Tax=Aquipseudomonas alcaligenes TaxID=43263 RepID=UPI000953A471|nr:sterol desaturase family protein [Pseudomonas alcaligenes]SIS18134.1 Sterol desaturase/sphingolipid hydroxylase, fatty acid hydroxylase superfamily [Pseudomonas alcaligenes]
MNVAVLAVPLYILLILLELAYERWSGRHTYRLADAVTSIDTAVLRMLLEGPLRLLLVIPYAWLYEHARLWTLDPTSPWAWLLGFVAVDFCFYWAHRSLHRYNLLWGAHQPHHSSEDFNLSTALRKGAFQTAFDWPFYLPLALLGLPLPLFLVLLGAQLVYQFWIHSQHVGRLGMLEWFMVTPSNHRVHHGQNDRYIDKNHGGVFIVWDRLFGTFADETEVVRYGVTTPVRTFDPLRLQFSWWRLLWADAVATRSWWDKLRLWWMPTGWRPADVCARPWPKMGADKFDCPSQAGLRWYAFVQFVLINALTLVYLASVKQAGWLLPLLLGPLILFGCVSLGWLFEGRRELWRLEAIRLALLAAFALAWGLWLAPAQWAFGIGLAGLCVASLLWLFWLAARPQMAQA